jgi:hypothetical protein
LGEGWLSRVPVVLRQAQGPVSAPHPFKHGAYPAEALSLFIAARPGCDIENGEGFSRGALCDSKVVLSGFSRSSTALGNVEHHGIGGPNPLVFQVCHPNGPIDLMHPPGHL